MAAFAGKSRTTRWLQQRSSASFSEDALVVLVVRRFHRWHQGELVQESRVG